MNHGRIAQDESELTRKPSARREKRFKPRSLRCNLLRLTQGPNYSEETRSLRLLPLHFSPIVLIASQMTFSLEEFFIRYECGEIRCSLHFLAQKEVLIIGGWHGADEEEEKSLK